MTFKQYRLKIGTQTELANRLGLKTSTVNKWERGKSKPKLENINSLAKLFKVSIGEIIDCFMTAR